MYKSGYNHCPMFDGTCTNTTNVIYIGLSRSASHIPITRFIISHHYSNSKLFQLSRDQVSEDTKNSNSNFQYPKGGVIFIQKIEGIGFVQSQHLSNKKPSVYKKRTATADIHTHDISNRYLTTQGFPSSKPSTSTFLYFFFFFLVPFYCASWNKLLAIFSPRLL